MTVRVEQGVGGGEAHGVDLLGDAAAGGAEVGHGAPRRVEVEQVVVGGVGALELTRLGERPRSPGRLAVQRRLLLRVRAVAQVARLAQHDGQVVRELQPADMVEVRRDIGVVRGDGSERACREPQSRLGRDVALALDLLDEQRVLRWLAGDGHRGVVRGPPREQSHARDVDHRERLVDGHHAATDLRARMGAR